MSPKTSAKELRKQAQSLGINGWESMSREEMAKAIAEAEGDSEEVPATKTTKTRKTASKRKPAAAKKGSAKKAAATKKASGRKATVKKERAPKKELDTSAPGYGATKERDQILDPERGAPTPEAGKNPFRKGSNMYAIAPLLLRGGKRTTLAQKLSEKVELHPYQKEEIDLADYDKRLILTAQVMKDKYGYAIRRTGRGMQGGTIKVFVPGSADDPRKSNGTTKKKVKAKG